MLNVGEKCILSEMAIDAQFEREFFTRFNLPQSEPTILTLRWKKLLHSVREYRAGFDSAASQVVIGSYAIKNAFAHAFTFFKESKATTRTASTTANHQPQPPRKDGETFTEFADRLSGHHSKSKTIILAAALLVMSTIATHAQVAKVYPFLLGGTETVFGSATNQFVVAGVTNQFGSPTAATITLSNMVMPVYEFDNFGVTWGFTWPVGSTNAPVNLKMFKSYDNAQTFEASPSYTWAITPNAAGAPGTWITNANLSATNATHVAFTVENAASGHISNLILRVNLKSVKYGARQALQ